MGPKARYSLDSPAVPQVTQRDKQPFMLLFRTNLEPSIDLTNMSLDYGRKPEYLEGICTGMEEHANSVHKG